MKCSCLRMALCAMVVLGSFAMESDSLKRKRIEKFIDPLSSTSRSTLCARIPPAKKSKIMNGFEQEQFICHLSSNNILKIDEWLELFQIDLDKPIYGMTTALEVATQKGYYELVCHLVSKGATSYAPSFLKALSHKNVPIVLFFAEHFSININAPLDPQSLKTPLHYACQKKYLPLIKALINKLDAYIDIFDKDGLTPIASFASINSTVRNTRDIFDYLFAKCNINAAVSVSGSTLLHEAVRLNNLGLVKLLVEEYGAHLQVLNSDHVAPISIALELGHKEIYEYLEKAQQDK